MNEWEEFMRRLTLERQKPMPRWNLTPAPEHLGRPVEPPKEYVQPEPAALRRIA